ncbi:MAG: formylglycine-generating enzyme family protein [Nitrospinae bacterium]|nr:formylglycine-generating enzyme family protein [Nitrospinota bacterium]MZH47092.1 formylglycine-generating enzyme family protein [Nitrospinota bacterium]
MAKTLLINSRGRMTKYSFVYYYTLVVLILLLFFLSGCQLCDCEKEQMTPVKVSERDQKEMVLVPAGEFIMGTNKVDEEGTHKKIGSVKPLYIDQHPERKLYLGDFYMDRYEVTNEEYQKFLKATKFTDRPAHWENGTFPEGMALHPVTQVTWWEGWSYCMWAGKQLPTEAQWEKSARGPNGLPYPWGEEFVKGKSNLGIEGDRKAAPVTAYPEDVSPYKIYGLSGNVMEWTLDWYLPYPGNPKPNSRYGKELKVLRGNGFQKAGHYFLPAYRYAFNRTEVNPNDFFENVGFRCASEIIPEDSKKK